MSAVAVIVALLLAAASVLAADRPARVVTPSGSPIELDPFRSVLFDSPLLSVGVRNLHSGNVSYALRVWIFQADGTLRGTLDYCAGDQLDRAMRGRVNIPLEIRGVTMRDRPVVTVLRAGSGRATWTLSESPADQLEAARRAAGGSSVTLTLRREDSRDAQLWSCPCDCETARSSCDQACAQGVAAFTCAPFGGTCSASCTCK
jgi:hypothetical protein